MRWSKVTPSGVVWSKKFRFAMSSLWPRAALRRRSSMRSGLQPTLARSLLTRVTTWSSVAVRESFAGALGGAARVGDADGGAAEGDGDATAEGVGASALGGTPWAVPSAVADS